MKKFTRFTMAILVAFLFGFTLDANAQQWLGAFNSTGSINRTGNVGIGQAGTPLAKLDVRGDNILLAPNGTTGFVTKFVGLGESGGSCNIFGYRAQTSSDNFINVGIKRPSGLITAADDYLFGPTIAWGSTGQGPIPCLPGGNCIGPRPRALNIEYDDNPDGCGKIVASFFGPPGGLVFQTFGSIRVNSTFISSDSRYKTDVQDLGNAMEQISQLRGVSYGFNQQEFENMNFADGRTNGFIAQEVKDVMPEIVAQDARGYYAINYDGVIPVLVEALKEENDRVNELEATVQDLTRQLEEIKSLLAGSPSLGKAGGATDLGVATDVPALYQNQPNPFSGNTVIPYYLPTNVKSAQIRVTSVNGQEVSVLQLTSRGKGEVSLNSAVLNAGVYTYSLIVNGERVASKRLVVN
ncbi:MAG: tail fiber domain-containing protein [Bacteroidota bacterium]